VFMNPNAAAATVSAKVHRGDGTLLSSATVGPLAPNGFLQVPIDSGTFPGVAGTTDTNLWLEFTSNAGVLVFASVINNGSGDPFAIVAKSDVIAAAHASTYLPSSAFRAGLNAAEFH